MDNKMKNRGQVAIFIIIGVLIASIIALVFIFRNDIMDIIPGGGRDINSNSFLESCLEDKIKETVETISIQGGNMNPILYKRFKFDDEDDFVNISYLCYNQNHILPCINQEPMLIQHLKDEIKNEIEDDVGNCFDDLVNSLDDQGYTVVVNYTGFGVELMPKKVVVEINAEMVLTKTEESLRYENFTINVGSRFYENAIVAQEIISQEAKYCYFEFLGFMLFYPEFHIDWLPIGDSTEIYTLKHEDSEDKFRFAVRGCETLPGF